MVVYFDPLQIKWQTSASRTLAANGGKISYIELVSATYHQWPQKWRLRLRVGRMDDAVIVLTVVRYVRIGVESCLGAVLLSYGRRNVR
jgi:hypothetical protein